MPPNIEFTTFFSFFTTKDALNCHFSQGKGAAKLFSVLQGAVNKKRLKNTGLGPTRTFIRASYYSGIAIISKLYTTLGSTQMISKVDE